jgi:hypothetical protein
VTHVILDLNDSRDTRSTLLYLHASLLLSFFRTLFFSSSTSSYDDYLSPLSFDFTPKVTSPVNGSYQVTR